MVPILPSGAVELTLFREPTQAAPEARSEEKYDKVIVNACTGLSFFGRKVLGFLKLWGLWS